MPSDSTGTEGAFDPFLHYTISNNYLYNYYAHESNAPSGHFCIYCPSRHVITSLLYTVCKLVACSSAREHAGPRIASASPCDASIQLLCSYQDSANCGLC